MKQYTVIFECNLPMRIMTNISANNGKEVIKKIENNEIKDFHFQTIDTFKDLKEIRIINGEKEWVKKVEKKRNT